MILRRSTWFVRKRERDLFLRPKKKGFVIKKQLRWEMETVAKPEPLPYTNSKNLKDWNVHEVGQWLQVAQQIPSFFCFFWALFFFLFLFKD